MKMFFVKIVNGKRGTFRGRLGIEFLSKPFLALFIIRMASLKLCENSFETASAAKHAL